MKNTNKLNELFSNRTFIEGIKDLDNLSAIYEAVKVEVPDVTMDELDEYLGTIAEVMANGEISEDELDTVAGGEPVVLLAIGLGLTFYFGAHAVAANWGSADGKAAARKENQKNSKKKKKRK